MTTPVRFNSSRDGQRNLVNTFIKQPAVVQRRILKMTDQQFIGDALLRTGPDALGGVVLYEESTPLYSGGGDAPVVAEYGRIPAARGRFGQPMAVRTVKRALAVEYSEEMRRRDNVGAVDTQLIQVKNTFIRTWENAFLSAILNNPRVNTLAATDYWDLSTGKIRFDIAEAKYVVEESDSDTVDGSGEDKFNFEPDTLVLSNRTATDFIESDDFNKLFLGSPAVRESLQYTGKAPKQAMGLDVVKSRRLPPQVAIVLQRKIIGGISDERPLSVGPTERDGRSEVYFQNVVRQSAIFIDQPKAACVITGVHS